MLLLGGALETCRRSASSAWSGIVDSFFLTAYFEDDDPLFDFMITWLGKQRAWKTVRDVHIRSRGSDYSSDVTDELLIEDIGQEHDTGSGDDHLLKTKRAVKFLPVYGTSTTLYFHGTRMTVQRDRKHLEDGTALESLTIRMMTRSRSKLHELLLEARKAHMDDAKHRVSVHVLDKYSNWRPVQSRPKRPLSSVILPDEVKYKVLEDAREFIASEEWYAERGIPFRRGYLLHGAPGSGKTSLINTIAGELGLDIYVVTLSKKDMDDATLNEVISDMPSKAIALIEDIDAAFTHDVQRTTSDSTKASSSDGSGSGPGVTLSGLLGAIDGVAAQEGRLLFATTNHVERLDPALSRPGRMDVHIEFGLASKWQAAQLFRSFYPAYNNKSEPAPVNTTSSSSETAPLLSKSGPVARVKLSNPSSELSPAARMPRMTREALNELAEQFAAAMPDGEFSMAQLQGLLMGFKSRPIEAVAEVPLFVQREREVAVKRAALTKPEAELQGESAFGSPAAVKSDFTSSPAVLVDAES